MSFLIYTDTKPYYVRLPDESFLFYIWRVIKYFIKMLPYVREYGIRYLFDTDYRRDISYRRRGRRKREGDIANLAERILVKRQLLERDGANCKYCKQSFIPAELTIDHITPLCMDGESVPHNLQLLCVPCHDWKTWSEQCNSGFLRGAKKVPKRIKRLYPHKLGYFSS